MSEALEKALANNDGALAQAIIQQQKQWLGEPKSTPVNDSANTRSDREEKSSLGTAAATSATPSANQATVTEANIHQLQLPPEHTHYLLNRSQRDDSERVKAAKKPRYYAALEEAERKLTLR